MEKPEAYPGREPARVVELRFRPAGSARSQLQRRLSEVLLEILERTLQVEELDDGRRLNPASLVLKLCVPAVGRAFSRQVRRPPRARGDSRSGCMCVQPWLSISRTPAATAA